MTRPRTSIANRLTFIVSSGLLVVLCLVFSALATAISRESRAHRVEWLQDRTNGLATAVDAVDLTSRTMVERVFPVLADLVGTRISQDPTTGVLMIGSTALAQNSTIVDQFSARTGGVATIFASDGTGFKRILTSLKTAEGTRAVGTPLDPTGAPYAALRAGKPFTGRAVLFGKPYMTHYDLLKDALGRVIGVLFVGFEVGTFDAAITDAVAASRFFDTGGTVVIDPRTDSAAAVFAEHPTARGKRVLEVCPQAEPFLKHLATAAPRPVPSPGLFDTAGGDRWAVASRSKSTGLWVVAEVSDAETMRTTLRSLVTYGTLLLIASLLLAVAVHHLMRRQVGKPLTELSAAARAFAAGDLSRPYTSERTDEIGRIICGVDAMRTSFRTLLQQLRDSIDLVSTASSEISAGTLDLSHRTEQAAANVQVTASSMQQLTSTLESTAESARSVQTLADSTLTSAYEGNVLMKDVVGTMEAISKSATRITDIIGTIDSIAFQTNILALNAAVEAARAGEQGRGFAVVASEVRSLAQRSAIAAKEIKGLIDQSASQVELGTTIVGRAGSAIETIEQEARRVNELVGVISHATAEQTIGVSQATGAVTELDQSTQQNAALVEQSSAATHSLEEQVQSLATELRRYTL